MSMKLRSAKAHNSQRKLTPAAYRTEYGTYLFDPYARIIKSSRAEKSRSRLRGEGQALFSLYLLESSRRLHTLPGGQDVAFQI
jgi:hypothetical protein